MKGRAAERRVRAPRASLRFRRARSLVAYWLEGRLTFENYLTRTVVSAELPATEILGLLDTWRTPAELASALPAFSPASVRRALAELVRATLVVKEGSAAARRDAELARVWKNWLPQASYHFSTKDAPFASQRAWARIASKLRAESPQPPRYKTGAGQPTPLPAVPPRDDTFERVLLARKTHREFAPGPIPLSTIAALLHYTWGTMGEIASPLFGKLLHKTSPSGGARHPGEVYMLAQNVRGLRRGIYHYNGRDHALERLPGTLSRDQLLDSAVGQTHVANAAAVFFMTAIFPRSLWKYHTPRAYRVVTLETGHLGQTFCLVATWLGLAPFTTAACRDTAIERVLGIDGIEESLLYLVGVGLPAVAPARRRRASR
jgi:SagB-type dehydrogenase family enzyme